MRHQGENEDGVFCKASVCDDVFATPDYSSGMAQCTVDDCNEEWMESAFADSSFGCDAPSSGFATERGEMESSDIDPWRRVKLTYATLGGRARGLKFTFRYGDLEDLKLRKWEHRGFGVFQPLTLCSDDHTEVMSENDDDRSDNTGSGSSQASHRRALTAQRVPGSHSAWICTRPGSCHALAEVVASLERPGTEAPDQMRRFRPGFSMASKRPFTWWALDHDLAGRDSLNRI